MYRTICLMLVALAVSVRVAYAQEQDTTNAPSTGELGEAVSGLGDRVTTLESDVDALKSLKISGYVQADWQHNDQISDLGGRAVYFDSRKNFFTIRRGRIKFQQKFGSLMNMVIQPDITEGGVSLREAYAEITPLKSDVLSFTFGSFNRPNYEVERSSADLESTERAQVTKAFYPSEYDLGVMVSSRMNLFEDFSPKLQVSLQNGPGPVAEVDSYKDIITRLTFPLPLGSESPIQADLGVSYYYGGIPQKGDSVLKTVDGTTKNVANDATGSLAGMGNRSNFNVEGQIFLDVLPFGGTILKGEFMTGERPTAGVAATGATVGTTKDSTGKDIVKITPGAAAKPLQIRNQMGYYAYLIQNVGSWLQLVAKYDFFDRNTDMSGNQVKSASDVASSVLGLGAHFFVGNMRFTLWYEIPTLAADEIALRDKNGAIISTDDVKDNRTTIRVQYKF